MNILHVGKYFSPFRGGIENYMGDLMVALTKMGFSCAALVHRHERSLVTQDETFQTAGQSFRVVRVGTWLKFFFAPVSPAFPWHLRRMLRAQSWDVLHLHMPNPSVFWALASPRARRIPWVVHWHADVITAAQGTVMNALYLLYRPFEQLVLERADAVVTTSRAYLESSKPLQPWLHKCHVIPLGLDVRRLGVAEHETPSMRRKRQAAYSASNSPLRVLAIGRLAYYKGFRYLVEATGRFANMHLDLVGDGEQRDELQQLVHKLDLHERVTFHGSAQDPQLAQLLNACDCLCLPSIERTEAFGMVLLEAMSFGKAIVASDVAGSGMGWVVDHGVTGLLVEPANPNALAEAFQRLADNRDELARMGRAGRLKFDQEFEINAAAMGIADTYRLVVAKRVAGGRSGVSGT